ncbi:ribonuclease H-like domain-containing protein [Tanacetum coccineum]
MVQKPMLNNVKKGTGQRIVRQVWNNAMRVNHQNFSNFKRDFAPTAVLTKSGIVPISAARQSSSRAATPASAARPINTVAPKPFGNPQYALQDQGIFDSGCSRHMTGNKFYLSDYQDIDGGFVAFGGSSKGGKITGKGDLTCLLQKATIDESNLMDRRPWIDDEFCEMKGIRWEFSVARTPHQNGIAKRKNRTLIEAARTMLADSKLPTTFWAEAVNTACYVQKRVLVIKPHIKTPYELFLGYSINSKAFRVFNTRTRFVEENLHINFLDNKPNVAGTGPNWMFDIDTLTMSMNYQPVFAGNQTNGNAGTKANIDAGQAEMSAVPGLQYNGVEDPAKEYDINGPGEATNSNSTNRLNAISSPVNTVSLSFTNVDPGRARDQRNEFKSVFGQDKDANSTYRMFTHVSAAESSYENLGGSTPVNAATPFNADYPTDPFMPDLEDTANLQDTGIFGNAYDDEEVGAEADLSNLETTMSVSPIPTTRLHKDHPKEQIIRDINSATKTRRMIKMSEEHAMISYISKQRRTNHKDYQNCLFACFLSQIEPKKVIQALADSSWVEAMQEELL